MRVGLATRRLNVATPRVHLGNISLFFFTEIKDSTNTPHHFTMASIVDERAPNVSAAMRRRIAAALEKGERPTLIGNNLKLGTIVLQRSDGRDVPALRELELQMARRDLPVAGAFNTFQPGTSRRGSNTYATDTAGRERVVARMVRGENRVTKYGRRYFNQPYARYIAHIPTYRTRNGVRLGNDSYDVTGEQLGMPAAVTNTREVSLQDQLRQIEQAVDRWLAEGGAEATMVWASDVTGNVQLHVDPNRRPSFSIQTQYVRDGQLTADTVLDRIVFGAPLVAEDMWQIGRLHEVSRRRSGECGLDVIVCAAQQRRHTKEGYGRVPMLPADEAAQTLVKLVQKIDPQGVLAQATFQEVPQTQEILGIDEDLRMRAPDLSALEQFKDGMRHYLAKPRTVQEMLKATEK